MAKNDKKPTYLRCTDSKSNHYKYYKMIPINGTSFKVEYGREGSSPQVRTYNMNEWDKKYREKIAKGYEDKTEHFCLMQTDSGDITRTDASGQQYKEIEILEVREIVKTLQEYSNNIIKSKYQINAEHVTQKMISDAQSCIDKLVGAYTHLKSLTKHSTASIKSAANKFNTALEELIDVIPRKLTKKVSSIFIPETSTFEDFCKLAEERIQIEEDLLNNMRTKVMATAIMREVESSDKPVANMTLLEALGIEIVPCTDDDYKEIEAALTKADIEFGLKKKLRMAWKVNNKATKEAYDNFVKNGAKSQLLWHGSRNENWWSIINTGLKIRPSNAIYTGSMFGDAIYFANTARKSFGYTSSSSAYWTREHSDTAYMALFDVAVGNQLHTDNNGNGLSSMTWSKLSKMKDDKGNPYHSVYAHKGNQLRNDELVVYQNCQMTIKYLVAFDA